MRQSVENGQQRIVVPAYRVAIVGQSDSERIDFRYITPSNSSYEATTLALGKFRRAHPNSDVCSIRVTVRK